MVILNVEEVPTILWQPPVPDGTEEEGEQDHFFVPGAVADGIEDSGHRRFAFYHEVPTSVCFGMKCVSGTKAKSHNTMKPPMSILCNMLMATLAGSAWMKWSGSWCHNSQCQLFVSAQLGFLG